MLGLRTTPKTVTAIGAKSIQKLRSLKATGYRIELRSLEVDGKRDGP